MFIALYFILVLIVIGSFIYLKYFHMKVENFQDKYNLAGDDFDKQYVDMYDLVWVNRKKDKSIADFINENLLKKGEKEDINILDCGCRTGNMNNLFSEMGYKSTGVDKSKNMLKKGANYYPGDTLLRGDITNYRLFGGKKYSHIYIGDNVLNMMSHKDMNKIIRNSYYWLKSEGYLVVDIKDIDKLDYFPEEYSQYYIDDKKNKHSFTYYKNFLYDRYFINEGKDKYTLYEKVILENNEERIMKHNLVIPKRNELVKLIEKNGFKYEGLLEDDKIKNGNGFDIMYFKKINL